MIEFAAICDDFSSTPIEKLPTFHRYVWHERYQGEPYAIHMHAGYFKKVEERKKLGSFENWVVPNQLMYQFHEWLDEIEYGEKIIVAGKNFQSFDQKFLMKLPGYDGNTEDSFGIISRIWHHRAVDPAMLYTKLKLDAEPPSLDVCLERLTGSKLGKAKHTALEDAQDVLRLLRAKA